MFQNIASVAPGQALLFDQYGLERQWTYWDLDYPIQTEPTPLTPAALTTVVDELDAALNQAVQRRLQADVPVASYLSGGLDSSLLAAIAAKLQPESQLSTFSITFPQQAHDESIYQNMMVAALGSRHQTRVVTPADIAAQLRRMVIAAETPLRESYNACSLLLSGMVHEHGMKVVLTGEGADELFGGYVGYRLDAMRGAAADAMDLDAQLEAELRARLWGDRNLFYERDYLAHNELKRSLYSDDLNEQFENFQCLREPLVNREQLIGRHPLHQRSYLDFKLRMADHLLADHGDRVSFANSVEARYPFLDLDVIDCARRIPPEWMVHNGIEKYVLKELARRYIPAAIIERPKFSFVAQSSADLLQADPQWMADLLAPERIERQGYFNPETVTHLVTTFRDPAFQLNQTFEDDLLMIVVTFGILLEEFIENLNLS
jgi:asparagine synthase (glutamine-hydrolysing)